MGREMNKVEASFLCLGFLLFKKKTRNNNKNNSFEPDLNQRPMDVCLLSTVYSPPLYQLSYRRLLMLSVSFCLFIAKLGDLSIS